MTDMPYRAALLAPTAAGACMNRLQLSMAAAGGAHSSPIEPIGLAAARPPMPEAIV
nr:hypothetical protein [Gammaproteobacteria bacterium]